MSRVCDICNTPIKETEYETQTYLTCPTCLIDATSTHIWCYCKTLVSDGGGGLTLPCSVNKDHIVAPAAPLWNAGISTIPPSFRKDCLFSIAEDYRAILHKSDEIHLSRIDGLIRYSKAVWMVIAQVVPLVVCMILLYSYRYDDRMSPIIHLVISISSTIISIISLWKLIRLPVILDDANQTPLSSLLALIVESFMVLIAATIPPLVAFHMGMGAWIAGLLLVILIGGLGVFSKRDWKLAVGIERRHAVRRNVILFLHKRILMSIATTQLNTPLSDIFHHTPTKDDTTKRTIKRLKREMRLISHIKGYNNPRFLCFRMLDADLLREWAPSSIDLLC